MQDTNIRNAPIESLKAKRVGNKYVIIAKDSRGIPLIIEKDVTSSQH